MDTSRAEIIKKMLLDGKPHSEIVRVTNCCPSSTSYYARKLGLPVLLGMPSQVDWKMASELRLAGVSCEEIRSRLSISMGAWDSAIKNDKVPIIKRTSITKEERLSRYRKRYTENKAQHLRSIKTHRQLRKLRTMAAYGGKCVCCEETLLDFLAIDHINNDGAEHRRQVPSICSGGFHRWLEKNGYPVNFQILCHNCNFSKHFNKGVCIHKLTHSPESTSGRVPCLSNK